MRNIAEYVEIISMQSVQLVIAIDLEIRVRL